MRLGLPLSFAAALASSPPVWADSMTADRAGGPSQDTVQTPGEKQPDLSLHATPAHAGIQTIAILLLSGEQFGFDISDIYANARRVIEANTPLNVAPLDAFNLGERQQVIRECAGRAACFAEKMRAVAGNTISFLLTVSADQVDSGYLIGFRLVDIESSKDMGSSGDEVPAGMSLLGAMEAQLPSVFPKNLWGQIATVFVQSDPDKAEVNIAGRACVSPCELTRLPVGKQHVVIRKEGYFPWEGTVELEARGRASLSATLKEPERGILSSWIFWTVLGVVVLGGGAATAAVLARPSERIVKICIGPEDKPCP